MTRLPSLGGRGEGWVLAQSVLLSAVAVSGFLGPAWRGRVRAATNALGATAIAAGTALAVSGGRSFGPTLTPFPRPADDAALVDTGTYAAVRHPIYGGVVVVSFGWGFLSASPLAIGLALATAVFFGLKSLREEAWLEEKLPAYADYRHRTRRFVPGLW